MDEMNEIRNDSVCCESGAISKLIKCLALNWYADLLITFYNYVYSTISGMEKFLFGLIEACETIKRISNYFDD